MCLSILQSIMNKKTQISIPNLHFELFFIIECNILKRMTRSKREVLFGLGITLHLGNFAETITPEKIIALT